MQKWWLFIIKQAIAAASPEIVEGLRQMVAEIVVKAKETENPWDDIFAGVLEMIVGKPGEPRE